MSDSDSRVGVTAEPACFAGTEEIRMVRSIVRLALGEAVRHGSYAASFHGFRVQAWRQDPPRASDGIPDVCLSVSLGEALVGRSWVAANYAQAMEPTS